MKRSRLTSRPPRRILILLSAALLWLGLAASQAQAAGSGPSLAIRITTTDEVSDLDASDIEAHLTVALAKGKCEYHLARKGEEPTMVLELEIRRWQELMVPGGAAVFDTGSGRYRSGERWEVTVRYQVRVLAVGDDEPLREKKHSFVAGAQSQKNPMWDPQFQSRLEARRKITGTLRRQVCKAVRELEKRSR